MDQSAENIIHNGEPMISLEKILLIKESHGQVFSCISCGCIQHLMGKDREQIPTNCPKSKVRFD